MKRLLFDSVSHPFAERGPVGRPVVDPTLACSPSTRRPRHDAHRNNDGDTSPARGRSDKNTHSPRYSRPDPASSGNDNVFRVDGVEPSGTTRRRVDSPCSDCRPWKRIVFCKTPHTSDSVRTNPQRLRESTRPTSTVKCTDSPRPWFYSGAFTVPFPGFPTASTDFAK